MFCTLETPQALIYGRRENYAAREMVNWVALDGIYSAGSVVGIATPNQGVTTGHNSS